MDAEHLALRGSFDSIVLSDLLGYVDNVQEVLEEVRTLCHARTRILINCFNHLWRPLLVLAERLHLKMPEAMTNWINLDDLKLFLLLRWLQQQKSCRLVAVFGRQPQLLGLPLAWAFVSDDFTLALPAIHIWRRLRPSNEDQLKFHEPASSQNKRLRREKRATTPHLAA